MLAVSQEESRWSVLEVFAGFSELTLQAQASGWRTLQPVDLEYGDDLLDPSVRDSVLEFIELEKPDLVVLAPPCGPWSSLQNLSPNPIEVERKRREHRPFWRFTRAVWDLQHAQGRLVVTEQPQRSAALLLPEMTGRPGLVRAVVDQCRFGLKDPSSQRPMRKRTALDCNDEGFHVGLVRGAQCDHRADEHQPILGQVRAGGRSCARSLHAGVWTARFGRHILRAAGDALASGKDIPSSRPFKMHAEVSEEAHWTLAAGGEPAAGEMDDDTLADEELRRQLDGLGAPPGPREGGDGPIAASRYGYIRFEGPALQVSQKARLMLAKLHATLCHPGNDRLGRMLLHSGASKELVAAARGLRCEVCARVAGPQDAPQASWKAPSHFNVQVQGDTFYVWGVDKQKWAVSHFVDGFCSLHQGSLVKDTSSRFTADTLLNTWIKPYGPPETCQVDDGTEFRGAFADLCDFMAVRLVVMPPGAKYKQGLVERHGAIAKIMILKVIHALALSTEADLQLAVAAVFAAKNRLLRSCGWSPIQVVQGQEHVIPASLMQQLASGEVRFATNAAISQREGHQLAERIRAAAQEAFMQLDSDSRIRRALNAKPQPPRVQHLAAGAQVYDFVPEQQHARLKDRPIGWRGPAVVVCTEGPGNVWLRYRKNLVRAAVGNVRLATPEEMVSENFVRDTLEELGQELTGDRRPGVAEDFGTSGVGAAPDAPAPGARASDDEPAAASDVAEAPSEPGLDHLMAELFGRPTPTALEEAMGDPDRLDGLPTETTARKRTEDPAMLPFAKRRERFEGPTASTAIPLQDAEGIERSRLEGHLAESVRENRETLRLEAGEGEPPPKAARTEEHGVLVAAGSRLHRGRSQVLAWDVYAATKHVSNEEALRQLTAVRKDGEESFDAVLSSGPQAGRGRGEVSYRDLTAEQRILADAAMIKQLDVHFKHHAVEAVPVEEAVEKARVLPSRMVLTNPEGHVGGFKLKGRWCVGGHRDPDAGAFPTSSPTALLLGHHILCFLIVIMGWTAFVADVSAAFLQGKLLPREAPLFTKIPRNWPTAVMAYLTKLLGKGSRPDMVRCKKGVFGLAESPRLWYQEFKETLELFGYRESRLIPCLFSYFDDQGHIQGMASVHVDDAIFAGSAVMTPIYEKLRGRFTFGTWKDMKDGVRFCGRDYQLEEKALHVDLNFYTKEIAEIPIARHRPDDEPLSEADLDLLDKVNGQLGWAARQGRYDLSFDVSRAQQSRSTATVATLREINQAVRRGRKDQSLIFRHPGCKLADVIVVAAADAGHGCMPRGGSQAGVTVVLAHPSILDGHAPVALLEASSQRIKRVVRSSLAAEVAAAALGFEHGDFVRAALAEVTIPEFSLRDWRRYAGTWRQVNVIDARTAFDLLQGESVPSDRRTAIDIAALRESLRDPESRSCTRWLPGPQQLADSLTKPGGNQIIMQVLDGRGWSLREQDDVRAARLDLRQKRKEYEARKAVPTDRAVPALHSGVGVGQ